METLGAVLTLGAGLSLVGLAYLFLWAIGRDIKDEMMNYNPFDHLEENDY